MQDTTTERTLSELEAKRGASLALAQRAAACGYARLGLLDGQMNTNTTPADLVKNG